MNGVTAVVVVVVVGEVVVGRVGWIGLVRAVPVFLLVSAVFATVVDGRCDEMLSPMKLLLLLMVAAV